MKIIFGRRRFARANFIRESSIEQAAASPKELCAYSRASRARARAKNPSLAAKSALRRTRKNKALFYLRDDEKPPLSLARAPVRTRAHRHNGRDRMLHTREETERVVDPKGLKGNAGRIGRTR